MFLCLVYCLNIVLLLSYSVSWPPVWNKHLLTYLHCVSVVVLLKVKRKQGAVQSSRTAVMTSCASRAWRKNGAFRMVFPVQCQCFEFLLLFLHCHWGDKMASRPAVKVLCGGPCPTRRQGQFSTYACIVMWIPDSQGIPSVYACEQSWTHCQH